MDEVERGSPNQLLWGVPEDGRDGEALEEDRPAGVDQRDDGLAVVEDRAQAGLALATGLLGALPVGDVGEDDLRAGDSALVVAPERRGGQHVHDA